MQRSLNWKLFALKLVVLVLLAVVAFFVYAHVSFFFPGKILPLEHPRSYSEMISTAVAGSVAAGLVVAYPLVRLFPTRHWLAGLIVALPWVELRVNDLIKYAGEDEPRIMIISSFELLIFPAAILLCAWGLKRALIDLKKGGRPEPQQLD